MTARRRLEAFWMAWEAEKHKLDPLSRSFINDLALVVSEVVRYVEDLAPRRQAESEAFWRLVEVAQNTGLVAPADEPPACAACRKRLAEGSGAGRGTDRVAGP